MENHSLAIGSRLDQNKSLVSIPRQPVLPAASFLFLKTRDLAGLFRGQFILAPHFVQKVAEDTFCVPQVGQSFVPSWAVVVGPVHIGLGGGWEILARLE